VFKLFEQMIEEIEMLCKSNKFKSNNQDGKVSGTNTGIMSGGKSEEINDELLCNICYYRKKDTALVPCGH